MEMEKNIAQHIHLTLDQMLLFTPRGNGYPRFLPSWTFSSHLQRTSPTPPILDVVWNTLERLTSISRGKWMRLWLRLFPKVLLFSQLHWHLDHCVESLARRLEMDLVFSAVDSTKIFHWLYRNKKMESSEIFTVVLILDIGFFLTSFHQHLPLSLSLLHPQTSRYFFSFINFIFEKCYEQPPCQDTTITATTVGLSLLCLLPPPPQHPLPSCTR